MHINNKNFYADDREMDSKSREAVLTDLLHKYQRRFRPVYMSLVTKEEFLDIISVEKRVNPEENTDVSFSEDQWTRIKAEMVQSFQNFNFDKFFETNFSQRDRFKHEMKCNDYVCALIWWLDPQYSGQSLFERPGAAMVREMDDYWILMFFINDTWEPKSYEAEMDALGRLIENLEKTL
jgi:hypothetical protein